MLELSRRAVVELAEDANVLALLELEREGIAENARLLLNILEVLLEAAVRSSNVRPVRRWAVEDDFLGVLLMSGVGCGAYSWSYWRWRCG